jgi:hypothetical protein
VLSSQGDTNGTNDVLPLQLQVQMHISEQHEMSSFSAAEPEPMQPKMELHNVVNFSEVVHSPYKVRYDV